MSRFLKQDTNEVVEADLWIVVQYLSFHHRMLTFLLVLCSVMGVAVTIFFIHHCRLALTNETTNESYKRADIRAVDWEEHQKKEAAGTENISAAPGI